jgi:hypothetical protein
MTGTGSSSPSEGFEPCEDRRVRPPQRKSTRRVIDRSRLLDCFSLHLEVDGRIPIRRGHTGVTKPLTDGDDVDARSKQVYGGTVSHAVGVQPLRRQRRRRLPRLRAVLREDIAHAESCERCAAMINEKWLVRPCMPAISARNSSALCDHSGQMRSLRPFPKRRRCGGGSRRRSATRSATISWTRAPVLNMLAKSA